MKPSAVMPAIMGVESLAAAVVCFFAGEYAKSVYWLAASVINLVWVWL